MLAEIYVNVLKIPIQTFQETITTAGLTSYTYSTRSYKEYFCTGLNNPDWLKIVHAIIMLKLRSVSSMHGKYTDKSLNYSKIYWLATNSRIYSFSIIIICIESLNTNYNLSFQVLTKCYQSFMICTYDKNYCTAHDNYSVGLVYSCKDEMFKC